MIGNFTFHSSGLSTDKMDQLSVDQFKQALPAQVRKSVNQELVDSINLKLGDPDMYELYRENLIGYAHILKEGRFKVSGYVDAVKYVSQKLMGKTNIDSFTVTFPDKVKKWTDDGVIAKDIASYVTAFNRSKMVTLITEQTLTPFWVMNQDVYQKAINTQAELMNNAKSEKVRSDAANSLLTHLKPPEVKKIELDLGAKTDGTIQSLRNSTQALVDQQKEMINNKLLNAQELAHLPLSVVDSVEGEIVE
jgi:hypothetical protein